MQGWVQSQKLAKRRLVKGMMAGECVMARDTQEDLGHE